MCDTPPLFRRSSWSRSSAKKSEQTRDHERARGVCVLHCGFPQMSNVSYLDRDVRKIEFRIFTRPWCSRYPGNTDFEYAAKVRARRLVRAFAVTGCGQVIEKYDHETLKSSE